jgi:endonuclease/exonuclease/phosphatase family metal-dependent hydrolase
MAQARALRALHGQACAQAAAPPEACNDGSPFQTKAHTPHAVLCGDFNFEPHEPEHAALCAPDVADESDGAAPGARLWDSWRLLHGNAPHPPTFRLYDRTYGPEPVACDFVFVSDSLKDRVQRLVVDAATQASDHQPVAVWIGCRLLAASALARSPVPRACMHTRRCTCCAQGTRFATKLRGIC